jgi:hypothetical protein
MSGWKKWKEVVAIREKENEKVRAENEKVRAERDPCPRALFKSGISPLFDSMSTFLTMRRPSTVLIGTPSGDCRGIKCAEEDCGHYWKVL